MDDEDEAAYALNPLKINRIVPKEEGIQSLFHSTGFQNLRTLLTRFSIFSYKTKHSGFSKLKPRSGHRIVADESYVYCYGGYNPSITLTDEDLSRDDWFQPSPLFNEVT